MSNRIHPTAIVHEGAELSKDVEIGPYSIIGPHVKIGEGTRVRSHVVIEGHTTIGKNNDFYQFCSIGADPQDLTYNGEPTEVRIGNDNIFREYISIHKGTMKDKQYTEVGNKCLLMAHVHLGHDVVVGNNVVMANSANIAGHVHIGDRVIIGGASSVSQFCTLGRGAYIGGASAIDKDIPIFCTAMGNRCKLKGINIIGLRRQGFEKPVISELVDFYRTMEASVLAPRAFVEHEELMEDYKNNVLVQEMIIAIKESEIGVAPFVN